MVIDICLGGMRREVQVLLEIREFEKGWYLKLWSLWVNWLSNIYHEHSDSKSNYLNRYLIAGSPGQKDSC